MAGPFNFLICKAKIMAGVINKIVDEDEASMRLDRWFKQHYPGLGFGRLQKLLRSGQIRIDGGRVKSDTRVQPGQSVRIPPNIDEGKEHRPLTANTIRDRHDYDVLNDMILYQDTKVIAFNKPAGLAVQGGSGINRSVDSMLESYRDKKGQKPRLVHRLDRDTSGVLMVARTRSAAADLAKSFRHRNTQKTYWALVFGVPRKREGRISTYLVKEPTPDGDRMRIAKHGERGADHAVTNYRVIDSNPRRVCWVEFQPVSGRTHQLRIHAQSIGHPIIGDPKYFDIDNWDPPGGIQKKLHLHARNIKIPHPDGGIIDVTASLPQHMQQSWNLLGLEEADGIPDEE